MQEETKAKEVEESDDDEVGKIIERESQEHARAQKEEAERKQMEIEAEKERKLREERDAKKLEEIRQQERDLLDSRSQPIRQYLMDTVVPHLTEGLIELCKIVPEDPTDYLANFLLDRADQLDELLIKQHQEEIRARMQEKNVI